MDQHDNHSEAPPPYPGHPSEQHSHRDAHDTHPADPAPAYEPLIDRASDGPLAEETNDRHGVQPGARAVSTSQPSSSRARASSLTSPPPPPSPVTAGSSSSRNPFTYLRDKKREREATKKVDFYEKHYGFVPKNVLTEAEWKRIRKEAVKVKVPVKMRSKGYHYW
ncbi:hypothetical protein HYQ46_003256 [Verticillium longisporum]|nr:hypothetical protein HYQ46_003256 [Verticillium longisporum]